MEGVPLRRSENSGCSGGGKGQLILETLLVIKGEVKAVVRHWAKAARYGNVMINACGGSGSLLGYAWTNQLRVRPLHVAASPSRPLCSRRISRYSSVSLLYG